MKILLFDSSVSDPVSQIKIDAATHWFEALGDTQDQHRLYLEIPKMHFPDLGSFRKTFMSLANLMRGWEAYEKCAIMTGSSFPRSSTKIEGTALPQIPPNKRFLRG